MRFTSLLKKKEHDLLTCIISKSFILGPLNWARETILSRGIEMYSSGCLLSFKVKIFCFISFGNEAKTGVNHIIFFYTVLFVFKLLNEFVISSINLIYKGWEKQFTIAFGLVQGMGTVNDTIRSINIHLYISILIHNLKITTLIYFIIFICIKIFI